RAEFHRAMPAELMAGAVVAVLPTCIVIALATFVCTAPSSPAASLMSPWAPVLVMVDQSAAAGSVSKIIVPLPAGPTEMAARAPGAQARTTIKASICFLKVGRGV